MPRRKREEETLLCPNCGKELKWYAYYSFNDTDVYKCPECGALWEEEKALKKESSEQQSQEKPSNNQPVLQGLVQKARRGKGLRVVLWATDEFKRILKEIVGEGE